MKLLLVDDSRFSRVTLMKNLKEVIGSEDTFLEASSGEEALPLFEQENPDLIFLDYLMPGISGEDVLKKIRSSNNSCFITVLTSNYQKPVIDRLLELGANLFIQKSINKEKITTIMDAYNHFRAMEE